ncbi:MAG: glycosyltransferase family 2 protein [Burkholderiaceae bacterium]
MKSNSYAGINTSELAASHGQPNTRPGEGTQPSSNSRLLLSGSARALLSLIVAAIIALGLSAGNMALWQAGNPTTAAPEAEGPFAGLAYNAFGRWDSPLTQTYPSDESIHRDMALLAGHTQRLRTYSSSEMPNLPGIAATYGLKITAGVWIDLREQNNQKEIAAAIEAANEHRNIERIMVGNETILSGYISVERMISYLNQVRSEVGVPVSTAEPWHVWLRYPELAEHVDFIAVHLLPYWEGVPADMAVDYALKRFDEVKQRFPGKHVVIGEIGWPSQGDRFDTATASLERQAIFLRDFLSRAQGQHWDYFLMEGIDQPWKRATEGRVGSYWGIMNSDREMKFPLSGPIDSDPYWETKAIIASVLALIPMIAFLIAFRGMRLPSRIFFAALIQATVSLAVWVIAIPAEYYMRPVDWIGVAVLMPTLGMMVMILLANGFEFAEMFFKGNLRRQFEPKPIAPNHRQPRVSIHLACCNEPPEMVIGTIDSLRALKYENFEVLVIDNNTKDPALWQPVRDHMATLGENFKFFHLPKWPGFKAGALNFALDHTDPDAEIIGVVDADYEVREDWLSGLVSKFDDDSVAVVQAPQAHRDWHRQAFRRMMNFEYDGFFRVGMHHRNERDAIIQHGTMSLIRASALLDHGKWSQWCICEDTELGLRLMKAGLRTVYVDEVMGKGVTPDTFAAFRKQRRRWAQGAMQIMKAHAASLFLGRGDSSAAEGQADGKLSGGQRYHFIAGWMSWFGDALHLLFAFFAMFWTIGIIWAPHLFSLPIFLFMLPVFVFFTGKALMGPLLYWRRVDCSFKDVIGSAVAGMALSHGIALGVFNGLFKRTAVFEITEKAGGAGTSAAGQAAQENLDATPAAGDSTAAKHTAAPEPSAIVKALSQVREEAGLLLALVACIVGMFLTRRPEHIESAAWMWILALQAVPYLAAVICAFVSVRPELPETAAAKARKAVKRKPRLVRPGMVGMPGNSTAISDGSD